MGFWDDLFDLDGDGHTSSMEEYILYKLVMEDDEDNKEDNENDGDDS